MEGGEGIDSGRIKPLLLMIQEGKRIALELIQSLNSEIPQQL
jgi:hypothetical protein